MTITSPCIRVCILDEELGFCLGCGRTRQEIAGWMGFSEEARRALMPVFADRLRAHAAVAPGDADPPRQGGRN